MAFQCTFSSRRSENSHSLECSITMCEGHCDARKLSISSYWQILHRGTDLLDCSSICVMWFYCIWLVVNIFFVKLLSIIVLKIILLLCSIKVYFPKAWDTSYASLTDISPAHYCAQMYCYVLKPKEPLWCQQTHRNLPAGCTLCFAFARRQTLTSTATTPSYGKHCELNLFNKMFYL